MKKFKLVVSTMSATRRAGGLFNSVRNLCICLDKSFDLVVIAGKDEDEDTDLRLWGKLNLHLLKKFRPYSIGFMPGGLLRILHEKPDVLHCHGVWSYNALMCLIAKIIRPKILLVVSPRGMLDEWALANSSWKKWLARKLYANQLIRRSDFIHALCDAEMQSVKRFAPEANVFILPNGVNGADANINDRKPTGTNNVVGYIGRLHPKKGLENLILAFKDLTDSKYSLQIAGMGSLSYTEKLQNLIIQNKLEKRVQLVGAKYGRDKSIFLHNCDVTVLPSYSEGLPMSVLDSWVHGVPTMITKECNFDEFGKKKFAIPIRADAAEIRDNILNFFSQTQDQMDLLGQEARAHALHFYSWETISDKYVKLVNDELHRHHV